MRIAILLVFLAALPASAALTADEALQLAAARDTLKTASEAMTRWGQAHTKYYQDNFAGKPVQAPGAPLNEAQWAALDKSLLVMESLGKKGGLKDVVESAAGSRKALAGKKAALTGPGDPTAASEALHAVGEGVFDLLDSLPKDLPKGETLAKERPKEQPKPEPGPKEPAGKPDPKGAPETAAGTADASEEARPSGELEPEKRKNLALNERALGKVKGPIFEHRAVEQLPGEGGRGRGFDGLSALRGTRRYAYALSRLGIAGREPSDEEKSAVASILERLPANADLEGFGDCAACLTLEEYERLTRSAGHGALKDVSFTGDALRWKRSASRGGELVPPHELKKLLRAADGPLTASVLSLPLGGSARMPAPASLAPAKPGEEAPLKRAGGRSLLPAAVAVCDLLPLGLVRACRRQALHAAIQAELELAGEDEERAGLARALQLRAGLAEPGVEIPAAKLALDLPPGSVVVPRKDGSYEVSAGAPGAPRIARFDRHGSLLGGPELPDGPLVRALPGEKAWLLDLGGVTGADGAEEAEARLREAAQALVEHIYPEAGTPELTLAYQSVLRGLLSTRDPSTLVLIAPNGDLVVRQKAGQSVVRDEPLKAPWFKDGKPEPQAYFLANRRKVDAVMEKKFGRGLDAIQETDPGQYQKALQLLDAVIQQDHASRGRVAVRGLMVYQRFSEKGAFVPLYQVVGGLGVDFLRPRVETSSHKNPVNWFTGPETWTADVVARHKLGEDGRSLRPYLELPLKHKTLHQDAGLLGEMGGVLGRVGHNTTNVIGAGTAWYLARVARIAGDQKYHDEQVRANLGDTKALWRESPEEQALRRRVIAGGLGKWRRELEVHNVDKEVEGPLGAVLKGGVRSADEVVTTLAVVKAFGLVSRMGPAGRAAGTAFNMYDTFEDSYELTSNLNSLGHALARYEGRAEDKARLNAALEETVSMAVGLVGTLETTRDGLRGRGKRYEPSRAVVESLSVPEVYDNLLRRPRRPVDLASLIKPDLIHNAAQSLLPEAQRELQNVKSGLTNSGLPVLSLLRDLDQAGLQLIVDRGDSSGLYKHFADIHSRLRSMRKGGQPVSDELLNAVENAMNGLGFSPDFGEAEALGWRLQDISAAAKKGDVAMAELALAVELKKLDDPRLPRSYRARLADDLAAPRLALLSRMTTGKEYKLRAAGVEAAASLGTAKILKPLDPLGTGDQRREGSCALRSMHMLTLQLRGAGLRLPPELLTYDKVAGALRNFAAAEGVQNLGSDGVGTPHDIYNKVIAREWGLRPAANLPGRPVYGTPAAGEVGLRSLPESELKELLTRKDVFVLSSFPGHAISLGGALDVKGQTYYQVLNSWGQRIYMTHQEMLFVYGPQGTVEAVRPGPDTAAKIEAFLRKYGSTRPPVRFIQSGTIPEFLKNP